MTAHLWRLAASAPPLLSHGDHERTLPMIRFKALRRLLMCGSLHVDGLGPALTIPLNDYYDEIGIDWTNINEGSYTREGTQLSRERKKPL